MHILKCHGLSLLDSKVEPGYALNCVRASQGMPTSVQNAKIACLDINLQRYKMQMGVQVPTLRVSDVVVVFFWPCIGELVPLVCLARMSYVSLEPLVA